MTGSGSRAGLTPSTTCSTMTTPPPSSLTVEPSIKHSSGRRIITVGIAPSTVRSPVQRLFREPTLPSSPDGAEYSDPDLSSGDPHGVIIRSQAWLTHSATRAIIYIKADNPDIGLVTFIGVGMVEVSACDLSVKVDDKILTGDELGMFHFGGLSHALIFGPKVEVTFVNAEIELAESYKVKDGNSAEVLERAEDDLKKVKQKLSECQSKRDRLIELQYLHELAKNEQPHLDGQGLKAA
ncbi:hypothetical protein EDD85DRAFT_793159 [Armillaria nabsnona]|nr:hypothetical protein EDD85DRAFT_793159 [Armillaria nabsnona]